MPDVLQKVINANDYVNGAAVVTVTPLPNTANARLPQTINDNTGIAALTGILDVRFDNINYYTT